MCLNPLELKNPRSADILGIYDAHTLSVPCGHCDECRDLEQSEWRTRICAEINYTYNVAKGYCIFLTFTYNNANLPYYSIVGAPDDISSPFACFNHEHVRGFLNRMGMYLCEQVGKGNYKFFLAAEYGSTTKRPHYHLLLHINKDVLSVKSHSSMVAESLRKLWKFGFMFPKFDRYNSPTWYIDDEMRKRDILLTDCVGSGKYVSKYATKDLAWYDLPQLRFLSSLHGSEKSHIVHLQQPTYTRQDTYLAKVARQNGIDEYTIKQNALDTACNRTLTNIKPRHWQSKGYGINHECMRAWIKNDERDIIPEAMQMFDRGIVNPLTQEIESLPRYYADKFLYAWVDTDRKDKYGRPTRERYLTNFGLATFDARLDNKHKTLVSKVQKYTGCDFQAAVRVATYNYVFRGLTDAQIEQHLDTSNIDDVETAFKLCSDNMRLSLVRSDRMTYIQDKIFRPSHYGIRDVRDRVAYTQKLYIGEQYGKNPYRYSINYKHLPRKEEVFKYLVPRHFRKCLSANSETPLVRDFLKILHEDVLPLFEKYVSLRKQEREQHYKDYKEYGKVIQLVKSQKHSKIINYESK